MDLYRRVFEQSKRITLLHNIVVQRDGPDHPFLKRWSELLAEQRRVHTDLATADTLCKSLAKGKPTEWYKHEEFVQQRKLMLEILNNWSAKRMEVLAEDVAKDFVRQEEPLASRSKIIIAEKALIARREALFGREEALVAPRQPSVAREETLLSKREGVIAREHELLDRKLNHATSEEVQTSHRGRVATLELELLARRMKMCEVAL